MDRLDHVFKWVWNNIDLCYTIHLILQELDTALVKLYAEISSPKLLEFVSSENYCAVEDTELSLMKFKVILYMTYMSNYLKIPTYCQN